MSLYCKRLFDGARTPLSAGYPGVYKLLLAESLVIEPGQTVIVDIGILLKLSTSEAWFPLVMSNQASMSRGLIVNTFSSLAATDEDVSKVEFTVQNSGKMRADLPAGFNIAQLVLLKTVSTTIRDVEQFPEGEPTFATRDVGLVDSMPKTDAIWFKKMYQADKPSTIGRFLDKDMAFLKKIDMMRETPEYKSAQDQAFYEARWVWDNMPEPSKKTISEAFVVHRRELLKAVRTATDTLEIMAPAPVAPKPISPKPVTKDDDNVEVDVDDELEIEEEEDA